MATPSRTSPTTVRAPDPAPASPVGPAPATPPAPARPPAAPPVRRPGAWRPYLILTPALLLTIGILIPFLIAVYLSLTDFSFRSQDFSFVGIDNYKEMFTDPAFWKSVWVTLAYSCLATLGAMVCGLAVALLLNHDDVVSRVLRVALIMPLMIAPVVATLVWTLITSPTVGILAPLMRAIGLGRFNWFASPDSALFSVVMVDMWVYTPFVIILALAGLRSVPKAPYEAALVDGASAWFTFRKLTLPMITPHLLIALIFRLMVSIQEFSIIFAATRGGPGDTLMTLPLTAYINGFQDRELGRAIPYMFVLWLVVFIAARFLVNFWAAAQRRAAGR